MTRPDARAGASARWDAPAARWAVAVLALTVSSALLLWPSPPDALGTVDLPGADKLVHAVLFAATTWALLRVLPVAVALPILTLQAFGTEVVQSALLPERSGDVWDLVADAVGTLAGWALWRWREQTRRASRWK